MTLLKRNLTRTSDRKAASLMPALRGETIWTTIRKFLGKIQTKEGAREGRERLESKFAGRKMRPHGASWATKPISNKLIYLSGLAVFCLGYLENVSCVH